MGLLARSSCRIVLGCLTLSACAHAAPRAADQADPWEGRGRECVRAFVRRNSPYSELVGSDDPSDARLARVPAEARRTIAAAGLGKVVGAALEQHAGNAPLSVELLAHRQELDMRLISLETQLAAVIFEAECTGELIEAMMFSLEDRAKARDLRLAAASLLVGAVAATAAGAWDFADGESNGPAVLALSGGLLSAGLGAATFVPSVQTMPFHHAHNLLAPIVKGADPDELFPVFVFRLLTLPGIDGQPSPRELLLERFRELIAERVPAQERARIEAQLYGDGGVYDRDTMALRERMYDALETELNALARDLELLDRFLVRALARDGAPSPAP